MELFNLPKEEMMTGVKESQLPKTIGYKGRRYRFNRLHGYDSAVYEWKDFEVLVKFESKGKWRVLCDTENDTKEILRKEV